MSLYPATPRRLQRRQLLADRPRRARVNTGRGRRAWWLVRSDFGQGTKGEADRRSLAEMVQWMGQNGGQK